MDDAKSEEPGSLLVTPRPANPRDNWFEIIEAGAVGGFAGGVGTGVYNDVKAACRAAVKKYRDRRPDPDGEHVHQEYVHQLVAETFIGPCPPGHKLVHLDGIPDNNHLVNLAYVPASDPRPAAPLKPRPPDWPTKTAATRTETAATRTDPDEGGKILPQTFVGPYKTVFLEKPQSADVIRETVVTRNAVTRKKRRKSKKKRRH